MKLFHLVVLLGLGMCKAQAQTDSTQTAPSTELVQPQLRPSPMAMAQHKTENCYLKLTYGQPMRKGRVIFGKLEPYGKLWRTGANEATELTFTKDVKIAGRPVRSGTYTLFSIPNENSWTIILNTDLGQWGAFNYKPEHDYVRVDVPAGKNTQVYEALTFKFEETNEGATLNLMWDDVKVQIPMAFVK